MLKPLRRRPLLVLVLALGLGVGPAASAFCAHLVAGHGMHGDPAMESHELVMRHSDGMDMGASMEAPPCHTAPRPVEPTPMEKGADCEAPCCTAAPEPIPLTVSPSVPDLTQIRTVDTDLVWTVEPVRSAIGEAERPPPTRLYQEIQRIRR